MPALARPASVTVLEHYRIDSSRLKELGMQNEQIISVYRSMYAHSHGMFSRLKEVTKKIKVHRDQQGLKDGKELAQGTAQNLWRCYLMMLEGACPSDYHLLTKSIDDMHQDMILKMKDNEEKILTEYH